jgi:hypothetical protein
MKALSPYRHELNSCGTKCADDCPACTWFHQTYRILSARTFTAIFRPALVLNMLTKLRALASILVMSHPPKWARQQK